MKTWQRGFLAAGLLGGIIFALTKTDVEAFSKAHPFAAWIAVAYLAVLGLVVLR